MSILPIVKHQCLELSTVEVEFAEHVAAGLIATQPELQINPLFQELVPQCIIDAPALHADDLTTIQNTRPGNAFYQERARLRAMDGDLLATALPPVEGYETYCQEALGLGEVKWLTPDCRGKPLELIEACYRDRDVRHELICHVRQRGMRYIHPHMGSRAPWELALLIHQASHLPVEVIAPPPAITQFTNDKGSFTKLVQMMFGEESTPPADVVWNRATAANQLQELAATTRYVAIKLPSAAGSVGNLLIATAEICDRSLTEIDDLLQQRLPRLNYETGDKLLVTLWADDLVASPSAQLWIPPLAQETPVLEGLFMQLLEEVCGTFAGFSCANLPTPLAEQITRRCLLLAKVFQLLGYVGRCSIDMLLVGRSIADARMQFVECNGRWGGTSLPMTLMNRIFSDWQTQPFTSRTTLVPGADQMTFAELTQACDGRLFRRATPTGKFILFNPQRTRFSSEVSLIALRDRWDAANDPLVKLGNTTAS